MPPNQLYQATEIIRRMAWTGESETDFVVRDAMHQSRTAVVQMGPPYWYTGYGLRGVEQHADSPGAIRGDRVWNHGGDFDHGPGVSVCAGISFEQGGDPGC